MPIEFEADLVVETDDLHATVRGEGSRLRVRTDRPRAFLREVPSGGGTQVWGIGGIAERLASEGVSVTLSGPDGDFASVGAEARSRLGRIATGSGHVEPRDVRALAPLAVGGLRDLFLAHPVRLVVLALLALWLRRGFRRDG